MGEGRCSAPQRSISVKACKRWSQKVTRSAPQPLSSPRPPLFPYMRFGRAQTVSGGVRSVDGQPIANIAFVVVAGANDFHQLPVDGAQWVHTCRNIINTITILSIIIRGGTFVMRVLISLMART